MTLKEKFLPRMYCFMGSGMLSNTYDKDIAEDNASECEKIADDYAIEFFEFHIGLLTKYVNGKWYFEYDTKWLTTKQLLEIFKKEKGL